MQLTKERVDYLLRTYTAISATAVEEEELFE